MSNSIINKNKNEPVLTQAQFDALENKVNGTIYHIKGETPDITVSSSSVTDGTNTYNAADKMSNTNPTGTGSFSVNRKAATTVGNYSVALGEDCEANSSNTVAIGHNSTASNGEAIAIGYNCNATQQYSIAIGEGCTASMTRSVAIGCNSTAGGNGYNIALGSGSTASGEYSFAICGGTAYCGHGVSLGGNVSGVSGIAGKSCSVSNRTGTYATGAYSQAFGNTTKTQNEECTTFGNNTKAIGKGQTVIGKYNTLDVNTNPLSVGTGYGNYVFLIGNGTANDSRSNALSIDWNGNEYISGKLNADGGIDYKNTTGESLGGLKFVKCTQAEYNAITPDAHTFYIIVG